MKKIFHRAVCLFLPALMLALSGCGARVDGAAYNAALEEYIAAQQKYSQDVARLRELEKKVSNLESGSGMYIAAVNATVCGESFHALDGSGDYTAEAELWDGMAVDYWLVNGERVEGGSSLTFEASDNTIVEAVLREKKIVRSINSYLTFIDSEGNRVGEPFTELCFEEPYQHPMEGLIDSGTVTVRVFAETDSLTTVDHWIMNGVALDAREYYLEFDARDISEATTFEPVFAACYIRHEAEDPSALPQYERVPLNY